MFKTFISKTGVLFLRLFSMSPFWLVYGLSDICFILVFHIFKYRRRVVIENLKNAFPEKHQNEIEKIAQKFFRHFCDTMCDKEIDMI